MTLTTAGNPEILIVRICDLRAGEETWGATLSVESHIDLAHSVVGIFYEGRRLQIGSLDEWGYALFEIEDLSPPHHLTEMTLFEVRMKDPPRVFTSPPFHPPLINSALRLFLERHRAWPKDLPLRGAQLGGIALGQANLRGVDFTGADLSGAKLWRADLTGAILRDARLANSDLSEAQLSRTDLQGADVSEVNWSSAQLKGADLRSTIGLSTEILEHWGELVTLDETQQARKTLITIAQRQEQQQTGHYRGEATFGVEAHYELRGQSTGQSETESEHTFYRSLGAKTQQLRLEREKKREAELPYAPVLPPARNFTEAEIEEVYQIAHQNYQDKLMKYQQNRSIRGGISFTLNMIPHGRFEMGRDEGEPKERPRHRVRLTRPLLVAETLVTQEFYSRVMRTSAFKFQGATLPAEMVSWSEAIDFCNRLSQLEGLTPAYQLVRSTLTWRKEANGYRLPTEAEWEYFAKASTPSAFAGSSSIDDVAWYEGNASNQTQPVGRKQSNAWGLYDLSGNVWEWCYDTFKEEAYHDRGIEDTIDPVIEGEGPKVIRGGSWSYGEEGSRVDYRSRLSAQFKTSRVGFRIVRSPKLKNQGD